MFVLTECSVCFEEYNDRRTPHIIRCGHVFCQSCLDALTSSTSTGKCPVCRSSFSSRHISKILALQSNTNKKTKRERTAWEKMKAATDIEDPGSRQTLALEYLDSRGNLRNGKMSEHAKLALKFIHLLVLVEMENAFVRTVLEHKRNAETAVPNPPVPSRPPVIPDPPVVSKPPVVSDPPVSHEAQGGNSVGPGVAKGKNRLSTKNPKRPGPRPTQDEPPVPFPSKPASRPRRGKEPASQATSCPTQKLSSPPERSGGLTAAALFGILHNLPAKANRESRCGA